MTRSFRAHPQHLPKSLFGNLPGRLADAVGCPDVTDLLRPAWLVPGARVLMIRVVTAKNRGGPARAQGMRAGSGDEDARAAGGPVRCRSCPGGPRPSPPAPPHPSAISPAH